MVDLSATGLRLRCQGKPPVKVGQLLTMKLESADCRIAVKGKLVWIRRKGLRAYEMGVHFSGVKRSLSAASEYRCW